MKTKSCILILAAVAAVAACGGRAAADTSSASPLARGLKRLSLVAVQDGGRIKPLSAVAAEFAGRNRDLRVPDKLAQASGGRDGLLVFLLAGTGCFGDCAPAGGLGSVRLYPAPGRWLCASDVTAMALSSDGDTRAGELLSPELVDFQRYVDAVTAALTSEGPSADDFAAAADALASFLEARYDAAGVSAGMLTAEAALYRVKPFVISAFLYLVVGAVSVVLVARKASRGLAAGLLAVAFGVNLAAVVVYGFVAGRIPVNNSYEGLMILAAVLGFLGLMSCLSRRLYAASAMAALLAAVVLAVAEFTPVKRGIMPPVPALQSLWLQVHVVTCFVAYAAFALGFAASLAVLASRSDKKRSRFDYLAYGTTLFGFVFLSVGILTGAAWAKQAWGRYWGFDPKETWALVTWLVYAGYLHLALLKGKREILRALAAVAGFIAVAFTFFGVNYLLSGLHAYA
ncbi:MAG: cytochrome c biogenesis protein CcsA [Planctomycetes bacterium]|nr:cytochrome c biogenesis protein CcsA [Planctomycetota bacterium]